MYKSIKIPIKLQGSLHKMCAINLNPLELTTPLSQKCTILNHEGEWCSDNDNFLEFHWFVGDLGI